MSATELKPFRIEVADADLQDLKSRLARTRWTADLPGSGWSRGVPASYLRDLSDYWRNSYDWRKQEARLNAFPQFTTEIDRQTIHFIHARSPEPNAMPLIISHGWPSSIVEFMDIIGPLTDPRSHGGDPADAFHVVAPSIPGFGFSTPLSSAGWELGRTVRAMAELMSRLGYERYGTHGGDIGAGVAGKLATSHPDRIIAVHVVSDLSAMAYAGEFFPLPADLSEGERADLDAIRRDWSERKTYFQLQSTRPQTLAHSLADSPAGQLAWIVERFKEWTNPAKDLPENAVDRDQLLTNVSLYWFGGTGGSSANFYWEGAHAAGDWTSPSTVPQGWAVFNTHPIIRRITDPQRKIAHWSDFREGGHFPAMEEPKLLVGDVRKFFRQFR